MKLVWLVSAMMALFRGRAFPVVDGLSAIVFLTLVYILLPTRVCYGVEFLQCSVPELRPRLWIAPVEPFGYARLKNIRMKDLSSRLVDWLPVVRAFCFYTGLTVLKF